MYTIILSDDEYPKLVEELKKKIRVPFVGNRYSTPGVDSYGDFFAKRSRFYLTQAEAEELKPRFPNRMKRTYADKEYGKFNLFGNKY